MEEHEQGSSQPPSKRKLPWDRPTVKLAGTIALLVRGGSAMGKGGGNFDGDAGQFQARDPGN